MCLLRFAYMAAAFSHAVMQHYICLYVHCSWHLMHHLVVLSCTSFLKLPSWLHAMCDPPALLTRSAQACHMAWPPQRTSSSPKSGMADEHAGVEPEHPSHNTSICAGTASALPLAATAMAATVSTAATTWRMRAPANPLWRPFWSATPTPSAPRSKLVQA